MNVDMGLCESYDAVSACVYFFCGVYPNNLSITFSDICDTAGHW